MSIFPRRHTSMFSSQLHAFWKIHENGIDSMIVKCVVFYSLAVDYKF